MEYAAGAQKYVITISNTIKHPVMLSVLEFVYTGAMDKSRANPGDVMIAAKVIESEYLVNYCETLINGGEYDTAILNSISALSVFIIHCNRVHMRLMSFKTQLYRNLLIFSIAATYLTDETGKIAKELFFDKKRHSDVAIVVENKKIRVNRLFLSNRSKVLSAMMEGSFSEVCLQYLMWTFASFSTIHTSQGLSK